MDALFNYALFLQTTSTIYLESNILSIGVTYIEVGNVEMRIYDRDRTICDVMRYSNKMDREIFNTAIQRYVKDSNQNVNRLLEYAKKLSVMNKVKIYIGVWL